MLQDSTPTLPSEEEEEEVDGELVLLQQVNTSDTALAHISSFSSKSLKKITKKHFLWQKNVQISPCLCLLTLSI